MKVWGPSIVGFGSYHYRYETGHEGDACLVGFSSRKPEIVVYIADGFESREKLLQELGKHRTGKVCVYIKRLSDIDVAVLERLVKGVSGRDAKTIPVVRVTPNHSFNRAG